MANAPNWTEVFSSPLMTFIVGETKMPAQIHAGAIYSLSERLSELVDQHASDEMPIVIEHVDVETFSRFGEFVYRGFYAAPVVEDAQISEHSNSHSNESEASASEDDADSRQSGVGCSNTPSPIHKKDASYYRFVEKFRSMKFYDAPAMVSVNPNIIFHAKLYVFAVDFQILPLQRQCLSKLHRDLCDFYMNPSDLQKVLDLIEYVYTHTKNYESGLEPTLRSLVLQYLMCQVGKLISEERFEQILRKNVDLSIDIVREVLKEWMFELLPF